MVKHTTVLPDGGLLFGPERDLAGGQEEVEEEGEADNWPTYLGHVSVLKESGKGIHGLSAKVNAGNQYHMAPHKQD
jgi:hypothetical protein